MSTAKPKIYPGLEGIYFTRSDICKVDGLNGKLYYRGYKIEDLAAHSSFEEVSYLLLHGHLPSRKEFNTFKRAMSSERNLPKKVIELIKEESKRAHPMHVLRTAVSSLPAYDEGADDMSIEANMRKSISIISKVTSMVAAIGRFRYGKAYVKPNPKLGHAENFLYMLNGKKPDKAAAKLLDTMLILHAEHSSNASTFATLVTGATQADLYSAVVSGIAALKGPLHGGADERTLHMLREIKSPKNAEKYITESLAKKRRIMGFGHRVYKAYDPRAKVIKAHLMGLEKNSNKGVNNLVETALYVEELMISKLGKRKGIWPNVDFFTGLVYLHIGIPEILFTPLFAASRAPGWCAHMLEYWENSRLIRPLEYYEGQTNRRYVKMGSR